MLQAESNITEAFNLVKVINTHEEQDILQLIPLIKKYASAHINTTAPHS